MTEPLITIVTANYNTSDFIKLMLYALDKLTFNPYKVIICDNGSKDSDILNLVKIAQNDENVELVFRKQTSEASQAHAEALDILISKANTKYTVTLDSDCTFLVKDWDTKLLKEINGKIKIVGSGFPSINKENKNRGKGFPLPFISLFETEVYKELNISCLPGDIKKAEDTCWQWPHKFTHAGYKGFALVGKNTRYFKKGRFGGILGVAEYYTTDGNLTACHFGRGASSGAAKYFKWLKIPVFSGLLKRCCGRIDKKKWISKCYEIINEQR